MQWILLEVLCILAYGTVGISGRENFFNYRTEYDDDLDFSSEYQNKLGNRRDYYEDEEMSYRSDLWGRGYRRGWRPAAPSFSLNRIVSKAGRPENLYIPRKMTSRKGWDDQMPLQWASHRRRKPSYIVKIRRPVKKRPIVVFIPPSLPAWVYFRPPNPGRAQPGRSPPTRPNIPETPIQQRPNDKFTTSWEEDSAPSFPKDASYSFGYNAGDHERSEYADPWGTVRGSYSYVDPSGIRRTVHYTAGAATGFKILSSQPSKLIERVYRDPIVLKRKPSAFVYHLHPDGGWKPWTGRKETRREQGSMSLDNEPEEELALEETRLEALNPGKEVFEKTRQRNERYEPELERLQEKRSLELRGYKGGYGDENPLLVMETKRRVSPGKMMALRMRRKKVDHIKQRHNRNQQERSPSS